MWGKNIKIIKNLAEADFEFCYIFADLVNNSLDWLSVASDVGADLVFADGRSRVQFSLKVSHSPEQLHALQMII